MKNILIVNSKRIKFGLSILALTLFLTCQQNKSANNPVIKKGMIKVTVLYPNGEEKKFDMDYYVNKHFTLLKNLFGDAMKTNAIDKGIAGGTPGTPMPYLAIGYLYFENIADYRDGIKVHLEEILADIPKYTNITPVVQISEVIQ
jgi:uncharacterized protein (TIGR02118 family)